MKFRRIDIHAHVNFAAYDADRDGVIKRALDAGTAIINVGTQVDTSRQAVELARKYEKGVYAIVGLHPVHTTASLHDKEELGEGGAAFYSRGEIFDAARYKEYLSDPRVVGIGEIGLDYYHFNPASNAKQQQDFISQIGLANESSKPMMLHIREAYRDAHRILIEHAKTKGNVHFFAGTIEEARLFLDAGFTLSFTGVITFAEQYKELVEFVPLDMIQAETDSPFVSPAPLRGKRNEPANVSYVVAKIAEIKKMSLDKVEDALLENARRVWGLKDL